MMFIKTRKNCWVYLQFLNVVHLIIIGARNALLPNSNKPLPDIPLPIMTQFIDEFMPRYVNTSLVKM